MIALTSSRSKLASPLFDGMSRALNLLIRPAPLVGVSLLTTSVCSDSLRLRAFTEFEELMASLFVQFLDCDANTLIRVHLPSTLTDSPSHFLPDLAGFYAFLAEIRNCPA